MTEEKKVKGLSPNDNLCWHQLQVFRINVDCWFQELRPDFSGQESDLLIDWYRKADSNVDLAEKGNTIYYLGLDLKSNRWCNLRQYNSCRVNV